MVEFPTLPPLPDNEYKTLMVDPPWAYDDDMPGPGRGSSSHYDTLHFGTILGMAPQIREITSPTAHLYLWTTNSFMREALLVANEWGFEQKTVITWVKVKDEPGGLPHTRNGQVGIEERIGMGHYLRNVTEHILFCTKGNLSTNRSDVPNVFFAERKRHSEKPDKSYDLAEELSPAPRLDMFSRKRRAEWDLWGDEAPPDSDLSDFI